MYSLYEIVNAATGEHHHYTLRIETFALKQTIWSVVAPKSVTLMGKTPDELTVLSRLLDVVRGGELPGRSGDYVVIPKPKELDSSILHQLVAAATVGERTDLLLDLLSQIHRNPSLLDELVYREKDAPADFEKMSAVLNYARYSNALDELMRLVDESDSEYDFQALLEANSWIFGSEYSERLERRKWVRDSDFDHVMRNTTDGFLELIEIKTPMSDCNLFIYDKSHDCYYPSAPLSKVIGQVLHYLDVLEQDRNNIRAKDCEDVNKIRAKIIIGREKECDVQALRNLNGHLHRIEIITYDQLTRMAERVLGFMRQIIDGDDS